ncbi:MAG: translation initiation factor IF-2 [Acidiferrobacterales bacterium]|nr:translation initiation factor IF-2 [Acidiferrobacterales bacterium]
MSQVTISSFAKQIGISIDKLLEQLDHAGIKGKGADDLLEDSEKITLLQFLKGEASREQPGRQRITLKRKTTDEIRQTSKTGAARTVHVETRKKRTFVKRSVLEAEQAEEQRKIEEEEKQRQLEIEAEREREQQEILAREAAEKAERDAEERARQEEEQRQKEEQERQEKERIAAEEAAKAAAEEAAAAPAPAPKAEPEAVSKPAAPAPKPAEKPTAAPKSDDWKNKKGRKGGKSDGPREELHASKRRKERPRRAMGRKAGNISSSVADQHAFAKPTAPVVHEVHVPETITVGELAQAMSIKAGEVIKTMMSMGSMVTINQILDQDTALLLVEEMGHKGIAAADQDPEALLVDTNTDGIEVKSRAPVVTVMGHVDHGKTSLLDYLRKAKVASGEAGGITQHIGAYKVRLGDNDICFLDTPGHEAFSAMRARGASATDLVILVVAGDDGVKPQTIEAIRHARSANVPMIVAINKMDREQADPDRVKQELANHEVIPEEWGGDTLMNEVSALTGQGVDELLESVLLQAEVADLKARDTGPASGLVVEARLDKGRGPVATVLVQEGQLKKGDIILAGRESGRVRVLLDDTGKPVNSAGPSTPVEIQGLAGVPIAGDEIVAVADERKAREIAMHRQSKYKEVKLAQQQKAKLESMFNRMEEGEVQSLNLVVKADVQGSVEALSDSLEKLTNDEITVKVVHGMVGGINESDVNLALASGAIIVGFNVRADATARKLIESEDVDVRYHNVIYDVVDLVKAAMTGMLSPVIQEQHVGLVEVRDVFKAPKIGSIAGCFVLEGFVKRSLPVRVLRDNIVIFEGAIDSLRRFKDDVQEVKNGFECGIGIKNYNDIKVGDQIEVFQMVETAQTL